MINIMQFTPPPRNYVKSTLAWRLGKVAAVIVLAGLAVAGGLAFPGAKDAAAYDGYTYTTLLCQEYGQQPKRYQVRDPIPGSDWRNDGGWAIVLIRSANVRRAEYQFPVIGDHIDSEVRGGLGSASAMFTAVFNGWTGQDRLIGAGANGAWENPAIWNFRSGTLLIAQDGTQGFTTASYYGRAVVVDRNNNGVLDVGDMGHGSALGQGDNLYYAEKRAIVRVVDPLNYGAQYVRWANLAWCR